MELLTVILMLVGLGLGLGGAIVLYKSVKPCRNILLAEEGKSKEARPSATMDERLAKIGIGLIAFGFIVQLLVVLFQLIICVSSLAIEDGVRYNARAFNWDEEKFHDVQVEFCKDETTIYFFDGWHEPRTLTLLLYPRQPKDPKKIEAMDEERDVSWDIEIKK